MEYRELIKGSNCEKEFRAAYENRYTWEPSFKGYSGNCLFEKDNDLFEGSFSFNTDLKIKLEGIDNEIIKKSIQSQLVEVAIHRVRRPFEKVHGENTFEVGDIDKTGIEVIVGGKNNGDKYRISKNIVTMVYRHIHSNLILIFTNEVTNTKDGYLSKTYTSEYLDPTLKIKLSPKRMFTDQFIPLNQDGTFVLSQRVIETETFNGKPSSKERYSFFNLLNN